MAQSPEKENSELRRDLLDALVFLTGDRMVADYYLDYFCKLGTEFFPKQTRAATHHNENGIIDGVFFGFGEKDKEGEIAVVIRTRDAILEITGKMKAVIEGRLVIPGDEAHLKPLVLLTDKGSLAVLDFKNKFVERNGKKELVRQPMVAVTPLP